MQNIVGENKVHYGECGSSNNYCVRGTITQPLICVGCSVHYWVSCSINKGGFFETALVVVVVVDTHLPRFEALAYVLPHFDALTHVVIRVSSAFIFQTFAEVCYSVFLNCSSFKSVLNLRKAYIFKSFLKVYYRSVFAESFKTFIFQKFPRPLCHKVNSLRSRRLEVVGERENGRARGRHARGD